MPAIKDGPVSSLFSPVTFGRNDLPEGFPASRVSDGMAAQLEHAPRGSCVAWGIPFHIDSLMLIKEAPFRRSVSPFRAPWLVFLHTSDVDPLRAGPTGFISPMPGAGRLGEHAADYVIEYADGTEERLAILRRHHVGDFTRWWGQNCFQAVADHKPVPIRASHEQTHPYWGQSQTRADANDFRPWTNWLTSWQNPHPEKEIVGLRFEPDCGALVLSALTMGQIKDQPLRWERRSKAILRLPAGETFHPDLNEDGLLSQIQLDLGQVISALPRPIYPEVSWEQSDNNELPKISQDEILVEYAAHPQACFHLAEGQTIPLTELTEAPSVLSPVKPARQRVEIKVVERGTKRPVAVKLHIHGAEGEYLAPLDRHRIINPAWFEDYSVDFSHRGQHSCTYITGETTVDLPLGKIYVEISKGFEIRPLRQAIEITPATEEIQIEVENVLRWRDRGWVTADTHVHFLSPIAAMLEGAAEGVNVVNLLASQWGELMTNVGDFDGSHTWGSRETGGEGEYLVRVGTENRQHVLGHISLLGYQGRLIAPMTTGGADESAIGDPVETLLTEWARQCKERGGLVVLPHFPHPRAEHAAAIVSGGIDAVEMTSWGELYRGIDPYSLSDWYRYLNCGYLLAAVGGTDKMSAEMAVGTVRTYAHIPAGEPFTYESWKSAVRRAETFVTYGPLLEFAVEGSPMGSRIAIPAGGGAVDVTWTAASLTIPMTRVELIVNGEIRESLAIPPASGSGTWQVRIEKSSWVALLIRGQYHDQPEVIAAHSSPVMIDVENSILLAAADAVTILDQIEGSLAYIDIIGTRAEERVYKRMRLALVSAHRLLHNRLHQQGFYHEHTQLTQHE